MENFLKKNWITLLGAIFIFLSFVYGFKYAVELGLISDALKIGLGIIAGAGFIAIGFGLFQKGTKFVDQIISGLGVSILYTTFSFAGIYYSMWQPMTVFLAMIGVTLGVSLISYKFEARILMNVSLLGALIAPLVMKAQIDNVFTLFLYLLIVNAMYFVVSVFKSWGELRLIGFCGTWILYITYYIYFDPTTITKPLLYATSAFVFFVLGFLMTSWKEKQDFTGLNMYLGIVNAVMFLLWSHIILNGTMNFNVFLGMVGVVFLGCAVAIYFITGKNTTPVYINLASGMLLSLIALSEIGRGSAMKPIISVFIWGGLVVSILIFNKLRELSHLKAIAASIWIMIVTYWFFVTWETPLGIWFDTFVPIFNWSGMAWLLLAGIGFYLSVDSEKIMKNKHDENALSIIFAIVSHMIIGGLLTYQIDNIWEEYNVTSIDLYLTLSITWGMYSLLLFSWGAYTQQKVFRYFGSAILIIVAIKALFIDLSDSAMIYKIATLFILGIITFAIAYINNMQQVKSNVDLNNSNTEENNQNVETIKPRFGID